MVKLVLKVHKGLKGVLMEVLVDGYQKAGRFATSSEFQLINGNLSVSLQLRCDTRVGKHR